jgi:serine/threonine-protein kinase
VYDVVKSRLNLNVTYAGPLQLKNIQAPQPAYHLHPFEGAATGSEAAAPEADAPAATAGEADLPTLQQTTPATPSPNPRDRLEPGSKVGGRYKVQRVLGQGGFGRSYLVEDTQRFGELCVLKEFFPTNTSSRNLQKALDLFKREAKTLYQIHHPQIPTFHACFTQSKRLFIVQEYINGVTYAQLLKQRKREGRCFTPGEVLQWLIHMLQVLDYLHGLSVVHRDISPDNIIYSSDRGLPVLIDFGLVNDAMSDILSGQTDEADSEDNRGKSAATIVGKFGYSPPEQLRLGQCFPSSDLYALGVTAIVLLTGKYPRELVHQGSMEWDWQRHTQIFPAFIQLLNKMIRQRPDERFQSASEVLEVAVKLADHANSPLPQTTLHPIDLTVDPAAAPLFDAPLQRGQFVPPDPDFVDQCREELTRAIGPMASILLEDVLEQNPQASPGELVSLLAAQLSDGHQVEEFTSRIYAKSAIHLPPESSTIKPVGSFTKGPSTSAARENTEFLSRCRDALAQSIGPMANYLVDEVLEDNPNFTPQELVFQLASEIPDMKKAREFQQRLL